LPPAQPAISENRLINFGQTKLRANVPTGNDEHAGKTTARSTLGVTASTGRSRIPVALPVLTPHPEIVGAPPLERMPVRLPSSGLSLPLDAVPAQALKTVVRPI
jgi:hypothetical protein